MASRTSHLVNPEKGVLLYENSGTKTEIVSVHAVSHDNTQNPAFSYGLDTNNSRPLNFEKSLYNLSVGTFSSNSTIVDMDSRHGGKSTVYSRASTGSLMGNYSANFATGGNWEYLFLNVDPWMTVKPSEYGNPSDNVMSLVTMQNNSYVQLYDNLLTARAGAATEDVWHNYFKPSQSVSGYNTRVSMSYYNRGMACDQYTNTFMGYNSNAYMSFGHLWGGAGNSPGQDTRTSDSLIYQIFGTSYNVASYEQQIAHSPQIYADGGVYVINHRRYNDQSNSYVVIIPIRYYFGELPTDKTSLNAGSNAAYQAGANYNNPISNNGSYSSYFYTPAQAYQWHKYNKATDKYYFCFKHASDPDFAGIYEWDWKDMTRSTQNHGAMAQLTGNGPSSGNPKTFANGSWTKVSDYPLVNTNEFMHPPYKVGANLWVSQTAASGSYYSTDLKTWQTAENYFSGVNSLYVVSNQGAKGEKFYGKSSTNSVVRPVSGFADVPKSGLLENATPVGNYSRTGIILNPGDCIYSENADLQTALSVTVNAVDV